MACECCGLPDIKPTKDLPNVLIVRLTAGNIKQLLTMAKRQGPRSSPEWIARGMIWAALEAEYARRR